MVCRGVFWPLMRFFSIKNMNTSASTSFSSCATSGNTGCAVVRSLNTLAPWVALVMLRVLVGWEFLEAGLEKLNGENWFADIQDQFPFPFNLLPADLNWFMAMSFELVGGAALMLGLLTRYFSLSLIVLTIVATAAVHWPSEWNTFAELMRGYVITDKGYGNFKLPVIFISMLIPLVFMGAGKLSLDHLFCRLLKRSRH